VKERQDSLAARIADTITSGVRRRQQDREPRAVLYDAAGEPRIVPPGSDAQAELIEAAEALVELGLEVGGPPPDELADPEAAAELEAGPEPDTGATPE
jgi:hypothetical protein